MSFTLRIHLSVSLHEHHTITRGETFPEARSLLTPCVRPGSSNAKGNLAYNAPSPSCPHYGLQTHTISSQTSRTLTSPHSSVPSTTIHNPTHSHCHPDLRYIPILSPPPIRTTCISPTILPHRELPHRTTARSLAAPPLIQKITSSSSRSSKPSAFENPEFKTSFLVG